MKRLTLACALALAAIALPLPFPAHAADAKPAAAKTAAKPRPLPFHGNIGTVDAAAKTIKVGKRVFYVLAETKVIKNGQAATLNDAKPGDEVGGSYRNEGGTLNLVSLRIGPKP